RCTEERQGAVEAGSSSRIGQRSEQDAGGLIRPLKSRPSILACPLWSRYTDRTRHLRFRARSSAGEHLVDIEGVTGSIPVAPTIQSSRTAETVVDRKEAVSAGILPPIFNDPGLCPH